MSKSNNQSVMSNLDLEEFMCYLKNKGAEIEGMAVAKIVARIVLFILSLGLIGYVLWKLPIIEMVNTAFYMLIIPVAFLVACGIVSLETVKGIWGMGKMSVSKIRQAVEFGMEYANEKAAK